MAHLVGRRPSQLPQLGRRGAGWTILQGLLIAAVLLSALLGLGWPDGLELAASIVGGLLAALGVLLLVAGALQLGSSLTPLPAPRAGGELTTTGLYGRARHPMYGGGILFALGWSTIFASPLGLALTVLLALFLELKARREERWLLARYPAYAEYRRRTPRKFLPFLY